MKWNDKDDKAAVSGNIVIDEEFMRKFADYCLMDDLYMSVFFKDDTASAQCVLRIILEKPDLCVESVRVQEELFSSTGRRAVLDMVATDGAGTVYDIEVQRADSGADPLRARYYSSLLDANMLPAGADYGELREKYVIFITESDVFGRGLPSYRFSRTLDGDGMRLGDGDHIIYVNGVCRDAGTALGRLMQDFSCRSVDGMHYEELKARASELKESDKGGDNMSDVIRELIERGREQGRKEGREEGRDEGIEQGVEKGMRSAQVRNVRTMLGKGLGIEEISEYLSLSVEDVEAYAKSGT